MFSRIYRCLCVVCLLGAIHLPVLVSAQEGDRSEIDSTERVSVLKLLIAEMQSNYNKIETWKGEYSFQDSLRMTSKMMNSIYQTDRKIDACDVVRVEQGIIQFVLDSKDNLLFTSYQVNVQRAHEAVEDFLNLQLPNFGDLFYQKSVISSKDYISYEPKMLYSRFVDLPSTQEEVTGAAFRDVVERSRGQQESGVVDPRCFFGINDRTFFWDDLQVCISFGLDSFPVDMWRIVSGKGIHYEVDLIGQSADNQPKFVGTYTFAEECGFNPIRFSFGYKNSTPMKQIEWDYCLQDGIFIPSRVRNVTISGDGRVIKFERILRLKDCVLNEKIDASVFTYAGIGLKDGDRVVDRIERVGMVMKDGKPHKVADFGGDFSAENIDNPSLSTFQMVTMVVGLLFIFISVFLHIRKQMKARTNKS